MDAEKVVDVIGAQMRVAPPAGVDAAYAEGFLARNRAGLVVQLRAGLDQLQILGAQQDRLEEWREDHRLLKEALHLARQQVDPAWEARVAGWLLTHAQNEERALAGMWVHSSRTLEAGRHRAHVVIEHRTLAEALQAVADGARLSEQLHDELEHHLREEEAAFPFLRPAAFPYTSCGITQADLEGQQAAIRRAKDAARRAGAART